MGRNFLGYHSIIMGIGMSGMLTFTGAALAGIHGEDAGATKGGIVSTGAPNCYNPVNKDNGQIGNWTCAYVTVNADGTVELKEIDTGHR